MHFLLVRALKATIIYLKISVNSFVAWKYQKISQKDLDFRSNQNIIVDYVSCKKNENKNIKQVLY